MNNFKLLLRILISPVVLILSFLTITIFPAIFFIIICPCQIVLKFLGVNIEEEYKDLLYFTLTYRNSFNQYLPYKVVEVIIKDRISYKIIQQKKLWLFGLTKKWYDIIEHVYKPYVKYERVVFFKNKSEVECFVKSNTFEINHRETIVEEHQNKTRNY